MGEEYTYYAFISYSHHDEKWAKWLHRKLEHYRLPAVIRKQSGKSLPERIAPVFLDTDDLGVGKLDEKLYQELENSRYLIVICSPNSAVPNLQGIHYVNLEVEYFSSLGRDDQIIPIIIDGSPNDPEQCCFCPKLKKLGLIGLDATKFPRKRVLNDVIAKILGLRPDALWQREKRRIRRNNTIGALLAFLLVSILSLTGIWAYRYYIPYERYYECIGLKNLEPYGINPIEREFVRKRPFSWRLTYHKGRLLKAQYVNSRNLVRSFDNSIGEIRIAGRSIETGFPQSIHFVDFYGTTRYHAVIEKISERSFWMKYQDVFGRAIRLPPGYLGIFDKTSLGRSRGNIIPHMDEGDRINETGNKPTVCRIVLDENGFIENMVFFDGNHNPSDWNGLVEISMKRTGDRILEKIMLKNDVGRKKEIQNSYVYENHQLKNCLLEPIGEFSQQIIAGDDDLNSHGAVLKNIQYDLYGNLVSFEARSGNKNLSRQMKYFYDKDGFLTHCVISHDEKTEDFHFNMFGDLTKTETRYKAKSLTARTEQTAIEYFPNHTPKTVHIKGNIPFVAPDGSWILNMSVTMDSHGNIRFRVLDNGVTPKLEHEYRYNQENLLEKATVSPEPILFPTGEGAQLADCFEIKYTRSGRVEEVIYRIGNETVREDKIFYYVVNDIDTKRICRIKRPGQPELFIHVDLDARGRVVSKKYCLDFSGEKRSDYQGRGVSELKTEYVGDSKLISRQIFYGIDPGKIAVDKQRGYAITEYGYDPYGNLSLIRCFDADHKPAPMPEWSGAYAVKFENEPCSGGRQLQQVFLQQDGKTPMLRNGYYGWRFIYEVINGQSRTKSFCSLKKEEHLKEKGVPDEFIDLLYNERGECYGSYIFPSITRLKSYIRVTEVKPHSLVAQQGIKAGDFIIAAQGFDDRTDCNLSANEKRGLIRAAISGEENSSSPGYREMHPAGHISLNVKIRAAFLISRLKHVCSGMQSFFTGSNSERSKSARHGVGKKTKPAPGKTGNEEQCFEKD